MQCTVTRMPACSATINLCNEGQCHSQRLLLPPPCPTQTPCLCRLVKRAMHGTRMLTWQEIRKAYGREVVNLRNEGRWVFLNTLFSVSEAVMFAQLVDRLDQGSPFSGAPYGAMSYQVGGGKGCCAAFTANFTAAHDALPVCPFISHNTHTLVCRRCTAWCPRRCTAPMWRAGSRQRSSK